MNPAEVEAQIRAIANTIADVHDADVLLFNGPIWRPHSEQVIEQCASRERRPNIFLILTTLGGDPHAAYRIARALQQHYGKFIAFVPGYCKSAGTLLILGAHELVMSSHAELGPVDLQVPKVDEVGERSSVLTPTDALRVLQAQAIDAYITAFLDFREKALLPTRMAAEMSANLVAGLFQNVFGQVDPIRLGELERANRIAIEYGERLTALGKNAKDDALAKVVVGYPAHEFVIDRLEAQDLFHNIRPPLKEEQVLALRNPLSDDKTIITFLNSTPAEIKKAAQGEPTPADADEHKPTNNGSGETPGASPEQADQATNGDKGEDGKESPEAGGSNNGNG